MTSKTDDKQGRNPIRFLLGFVTVAISVFLTLRILGLMFAYSPTTAVLGGVVLLFLLYSTASRWVEWLPGLLVFGVFNSLIGLITHHSPRSSAIFVSPGVAGLLLIFYGVGWLASGRYDAKRLEPVTAAAC